jgi:uncharacterized protein (TIGR03437 family)
MRSFVFAALGGLLCTAAFGTTPGGITIISGNGQAVCLPGTCITQAGDATSFQPMYVKVTDVYGNPVGAGLEVDWAVSANNVTGTYPYFLDLNNNTTGRTYQSYTDSNGYAFAQLGTWQTAESGGAFGSTATVTAVPTLGNATQVAFYELLGTGTTNHGVLNIRANWSAMELQFQDVGDKLGFSGTAGSVWGSFTVSVTNPNTGTPIPNVALSLERFDHMLGWSSSVYTPSAYCNPPSGTISVGDYTVLTNAAGVATCNVKFGPGVGTEQPNLYVAVGASPSAPGEAVVSSLAAGPYNLTVTAATIASLTRQAGNNQSAVEGAAFASPLAVLALDNNSNAMSDVTVTWTSTGPVTLSTTSTVTNSSGVAQVTATAGASAGAITVTATAGRLSQVFTLTSTAPLPTPATLTIQDPDENGQSAVEGAAFAHPLAVVVMGSDGKPMGGVTVSFAPSGPVALSATSAVTNLSGLAEVVATAGNYPGQATVAASVGVLVQVFALTTTQPPPPVTASSFVSAADGQVGSISPCGMVAINTSAATIGGSGLPPVAGPLPYAMGTDTVTFGSGASALAAPIFSVSNISGQPQIVILVPCEVTPGIVPVTVSINGAQATINVNVLPASPGIFQTVMSDGVVRAVIERPDGSFASPTNPARRGEQVTAFVTGLGAVSPQVSTNSLPIWDTPSTVNGNVIVGVNNEGSALVTAQLSPDMIGVYYVEFVIPSDAPQNNNVPFSIGVQPVGSSRKYYSASGGSKIPVD